MYLNATFKSAFTCNRDKFSSWDETRPGMKKFLFTHEFHAGMKRVEFHPGMKFNLKENLPLRMKTYNESYNWYVETSEITFLEQLLRSSFSFAYFLIKVFQKQSPGGVMLKKAFIEISQNSLENDCARVSFLIKLHANLQLY